MSTVEETRFAARERMNDPTTRGLKVFLALTSPADPLRPGLEEILRIATEIQDESYEPLEDELALLCADLQATGFLPVEVQAEDTSTVTVEEPPAQEPAE